MTTGTDFVMEQARRIPVYRRVGVLVCGSGSAGLAAAVCAARNGADVLLLERHSFLGGESATAFQNWFGGPSDILTGFAREYAEKLDKMGAGKLLDKYKTGNTATKVQLLTNHMSIEPEEWKYLAYQVTEEAGVKSLTNTLMVDAIVEKQQVKGVYIENKSGRQAVLADVVVDATGDADVAAKAGAPIDRLPENGYLNSMVPGIRLGGINYPKIAEYARQHAEDFRQGAGVPPDDFDGQNIASIEGVRGWYSLVEEGKRRGEFPEDLSGIIIQCNPQHIKRGIGYFLGAHLSASAKVGKRYPWNAEDVMKAEQDGRERARKFVDFLNKWVPGFESCYIIDVSASVAPWDSRRIIGDDVLTRAAIRNGRTSDEDICLIAMNWPDIPVTEYNGWMMHPLVEEMDSAWRKVLKGPFFQSVFGVPYGCLIPKGYDGILVAGPTISMTYMAHEPGPSRGMIPCMHFGQAAGTAAAIASKQGMPPRQINVQLLRKTLQNQGLNLNKDAIDWNQ